MHLVEITIQEFSNLYEKHPDLFILDVRDEWELKKVFLKRTLNIPVSKLLSREDELPKNQTIYVLCHHGVRSLKVALFLKEQGYDVYSVQGGVEAWARTIDASIGFY